MKSKNRSIISRLVSIIGGLALGFGYTTYESSGLLNQVKSIADTNHDGRVDDSEWAEV